MRELVCLAACGLALLALDVSPASHQRATRTYRDGHLLYLESTNGRDTVRVGLDEAWGGAIVKVMFDSEDIVNRWDPGREVQLALYDGDERYDGCGGCSGSFGWNPTQAGDRHRHGSKVLGDSLGADQLYTKVRPLEWYPDNKGGGAGRAVPTDLVIEQWVSVVPGDWRAVLIRYRVSYEGRQERGNSSQELPAVYVNSKYDRLVYYDGSAPWTGGPVVDTLLTTVPPVPIFHIPEKWVALVDSRGIGLTVYVPQQYPYGSGHLIKAVGKEPDWNAAYYRPTTYYSFSPGRVLSGEYVLIPGDHRITRQVLESIKNTVVSSDNLTPFGFVDLPKEGATIAGAVQVAGWALDNDAVGRVEIFVDESRVGTAIYGQPRPDLQRPYTSSDINAGFRYVLDTRGLHNGTHDIRVKAFDKSGNAALFKARRVIVKN